MKLKNGPRLQTKGKFLLPKVASQLDTFMRQELMAQHLPGEMNQVETAESRKREDQAD